jgi:hypothetical protein
MENAMNIQLPPSITPRHPVMAGILDELTKRRRSDPLGELAREVLAGRLSIRDAGLGSAYAEPLGAAADNGIRHLEALGPAERAALEEKASLLGAAVRESLEDQAPAPPSNPVRRTRRVESDDDDWNERSVMVSPRGR